MRRHKTPSQDVARLPSHESGVRGAMEQKVTVIQMMLKTQSCCKCANQEEHWLSVLSIEENIRQSLPMP